MEHRSAWSACVASGAIALGMAWGCAPSSPAAASGCATDADCPGQSCVASKCVACTRPECLGATPLYDQSLLAGFRIVGDDIFLFANADANTGGIEVYVAPKRGGATPRLVVATQVWGAGFDDTFMYFGNPFVASLSKVPIAGGDVVPIFTGPSGFVNVMGVINGTIFYAIEAGSACTGYSAYPATPKADYGAGAKLPSCGGTPAGLDPTHLYSVAVQPGFAIASVALVDGAVGGGFAVPGYPDVVSVVDPDWVYYAVRTGNHSVAQIGRAAKAGGAPTVLVDGLSKVSSIAPDSSAVYFCDGGVMKRIAPSGSAAESVQGLFCDEIAIDDGLVYFASTGSSIYTLPLLPPLIGDGGASAASPDPCSATTLPTAITCTYPNQGRVATRTPCCLDQTPTMTDTFAAASAGIVVNGLGCQSNAALATAAPMSDGAYGDCHSTGHLVCHWPGGTADCPALWKVPIAPDPVTGVTAVVQQGCCGLLSSGATVPACGVIGAGANGASCLPPGVMDVAVF